MLTSISIWPTLTHSLPLSLICLPIHSNCVLCKFFIYSTSCWLFVENTRRIWNSIVSMQVSRVVMFVCVSECKKAFLDCIMLPRLHCKTCVENSHRYFQVSTVFIRCVVYTSHSTHTTLACVPNISIL